MKIRSLYDLGKRQSALSFDPDTSMTDQDFVEESSIQNIISRYMKTGSLGKTLENPVYGDFTSGHDYRTLIDTIREVDSDFAQLPSDIRAEFGNDASNMVDFITNPENAQKAVEMGLLPPDADPVSNFEEKPRERPPVAPEPQSKQKPEVAPKSEES